MPRPEVEAPHKYLWHLESTYEWENGAGGYVIESTHRPPGWRAPKSGENDAGEHVIESAHRPPGWD